MLDTPVIARVAFKPSHSDPVDMRRVDHHVHAARCAVCVLRASASELSVVASAGTGAADVLSQQFARAKDAFLQALRLLLFGDGGALRVAWCHGRAAAGGDAAACVAVRLWVGGVISHANAFDTPRCQGMEEDRRGAGRRFAERSARRALHQACQQPFRLLDVIG